MLETRKKVETFVPSPHKYIHYQHFYHMKCAMLLYGAGGNTVYMYVEISLDLNKAALYSETPE